MSLQFFHNLGKITRASLSHARLANPSFYNSSLRKNPVSLSGTQQIALISTSKKNGETITTDIVPSQQSKELEKLQPDEEKPPKKKFWTSQGFSMESEEDDLNNRNHIMFFSCTIGIVGFTFLFMYMPDMHLEDWSQREAYIELARREALGLPLIDRDLIPAEEVHLPTDEELGAFELVI